MTLPLFPPTPERKLRGPDFTIGMHVAWYFDNAFTLTGYVSAITISPEGRHLLRVVITDHQNMPPNYYAETGPHTFTFLEGVEFESERSASFFAEHNEPTDPRALAFKPVVEPMQRELF